MGRLVRTAATYQLHLAPELIQLPILPVIPVQNASVINRPACLIKAVLHKMAITIGMTIWHQTIKYFRGLVGSVGRRHLFAMRGST
jgi:hypothetical protein